MEQQSVSVRTALMPLFYKDFHCLAAACHDNCCGGWEIAFNKKDYLHIKRSAKSEELNTILSNGMSRLRDQASDGLYAHFKMNEGDRCAFQTEEGLCRLQLECGEESLPKVCRTYPRKDTYTPAGREFALSPSCEGVLALLWDLPQGIDFLEEDLPKRDWRTVTGAWSVMCFPQIRSLCVDILQERSLPLYRRMQLMGVMLQNLRGRDWDAKETFDDWLSWGESLLQRSDVGALLSGLPGDQDVFFAGNLQLLAKIHSECPGDRVVFQGLMDAASSNPGWYTAQAARFVLDTDRYRLLARNLDELLNYSDVFFENLMVAAMFHLVFPDPSSPDGLWRSYCLFCVLYSFYRFTAVLGCAKETSRDRLFQVVGQVSRCMLHNNTRRDEIWNEMLTANHTSMAYMAVLANIQ